MLGIKEFKINECLSVRFSYNHNTTRIIVNGEQFGSSYSGNPNYEDISIFEKMCSDLTIWEKNNYDTALYPFYFIYPLLRRLYDVGDYKAEQVFINEIIKGMTSKNPGMIIFLLRRRYYCYIDEEIFEDVIRSEILSNEVLISNEEIYKILIKRNLI